eukprot:g1157.t1
MSRYARALGLRKEVLSRKPTEFIPSKMLNSGKRTAPRAVLPAEDVELQIYDSVAEERQEFALLKQAQARRTLLQLVHGNPDEEFDWRPDGAFNPKEDYVGALRDICMWDPDEGWRPPGGLPESGWTPSNAEERDAVDAAVSRLLGGSSASSSAIRAAAPSLAAHSSANSLFLEDAPLGSGLRQHDLPSLGGPDEMEDMALAHVAMPDEFGVERYEDSVMEVRASGAAAAITVPRPNLVQTSVPQRGVLVAPPISATAPPSIMPSSTVDQLKADPRLEPENRVGVLPQQLLSLQDAIDAIAASLEPVPSEKHEPSAESTTGFESGDDSETDEANFELAKKGQFVPAAGGKQSLNTMITYKTQFRRIYEPLMRKCKLSKQRRHVSQTSLDILYRTLRVCGDFPQSRHLYFSQVKGHIEMTHALRPEVAKTYDKYFGRLLSMRKRGHQQRGFRASDMVMMANAIGGSARIREETAMLFDHGSHRVQVSAELAFRFMIACWWAFLRPDCSGHTGRKILPGGNGAVQYTIHSSKTDQSGDVVAQTVLECCCRTLPKTAICLCPVHCISCTDFEGMQRTLKLHAANKKKKVAEKLDAKGENTNPQEGEEDLPEEDREVEPADRPAEPKWAAAIERILELVGIDNPRIGGNARLGRLGRRAFGPYSVRIGGCQSARDSGTPDDYIQLIGRWASTKNVAHYKGLSAALQDSLRFPWPIRKGVLYDGSTNYNSDADWCKQLNGIGSSSSSDMLVEQVGLF